MEQEVKHGGVSQNAVADAQYVRLSDAQQAAFNAGQPWLTQGAARRTKHDKLDEILQRLKDLESRRCWPAYQHYQPCTRPHYDNQGRRQYPYTTKINTAAASSSGLVNRMTGCTVNKPYAAQNVHLA